MRLKMLKRTLKNLQWMMKNIMIKAAKQFQSRYQPEDHFTLFDRTSIVTIVIDVISIFCFIYIVFQSIFSQCRMIKLLSLSGARLQVSSMLSCRSEIKQVLSCSFLGAMEVVQNLLDRTTDRRTYL